MKWSKKAEEAVQKVPFFVRKKVRGKIEQYVLEHGRDLVSLEDTQTARNKFLSNMSKDIKGYQADRCFGASGCPHAINGCGSILTQAESLLENEKILDFLKQHVDGELKYHHEFRLSTADCPNACSQPQIKDVGIIGAVKPDISKGACSMCRACVRVCPDNCIFLKDAHTADEFAATNETSTRKPGDCKTGTHETSMDNPKPEIDAEKCMMCGKCIDICPTGTICEGKKGFRVMLGGRLGRHPRLAMELPDLLSEEEVFSVLKRVLKFYKENSTGGARFAKIVREEDMQLF